MKAFKAKILLVEDSEAQAKVAKEFLENNSYDVVWVADGKSAIKVAKTEAIDIILLDLVLPDISGNEICRWLKVDAETKGIPIIMLTVKDSVDDKVTSLESGADDYLSKPYNEVELNARIYASLRTKSLQDELKEKNRQLEGLLARVEYLAITDPLTDLYNRRRFETVIEKEFKKSKRYNTPLSCLVMDIDKFKDINDSYGHQVGDKVLKEIGQIIKECIREVDTPARWGGEEFIVLCSQTKKEDSIHLANRIATAMNDHQFSGVSGSDVTLSIGIAGIPNGDIDSHEKLIHQADLAMYDAKLNGRNRIEIA
ncbi:MAG: diguanylate cyclase [Nitrospirota bacterium]|nr:MAG: diguanylate cyclase [Nitrospirota bacterium]